MKFVPSMLFLSCALLASSSHADILSSTTTSTLQSHKKINLNSASAEDLTHAIKGIGHKRALAIVQYRQKHGHFKTITDLASVRGIGLRFVQTHRADLDATFIC